MISHCVIKGSAEAAQRYFNSPAEYYSGKDESRIFIRASKEIVALIEEKGLKGFENIGRRLSYFSGRKRLGIDFTLSFGKEVSLLAVQDEKVLQEVREVVKETMGRMQGYVYTRDRKQGHKRYVRAQALVHAFQHWTSREQDPQLHFHMLFSNQVYCKERQDFLALSAEKLVELKFYFDVIAQYETARRLQSLGYTAGLDEKGQAVLKNDRDLIDHFSTRRKEILSAVKDPTSRSARERANLRTRPSKKHKPLEELVKEWFGRLKALGKIDFAPEQSYSPPLSEDEVRKVIDDVIILLEKEQGVFMLETLEQYVLKQIARTSQEEGRFFVSYDVVHKLVIEKVKDLYVQVENRQGMQTLWLTTHGHSYRERKTLNLALSLAEREDYYWRIYAEDYIKGKGFSLSQDQRAAVELVLSGKSLVLINGRAGAGKTTVAEVVARAYKDYGIEVLALAPTRKVAEGLSKSTGWKASTVDNFLLAYERGRIDVRGKVLFVDEAGGVSSKALIKLLWIAARENTKVVLQGDHKQLPPVEGTHLYYDLFLNLPAKAKVELTTIRRQKDERYLTITKALLKYNFRTALTELLQGDYFRGQEEEDIIRSYLQEPSKTLLVCGKNATRDKFNRLVRERLKTSGKIADKEKTFEVRKILNVKAPEDLKAGDRIKLKRDRKVYEVVAIAGYKVLLRDHKGQAFERAFSELSEELSSVGRQETIAFAVGDRVLTLKNDHVLGVKNGELWQVITVKGKQMKLKNNRTTLWINLKDYNYLDYAYAVNTHKVQGMTVGRVLVVDDGMVDYHLGYGAIIRGKEELKVYTQDKVSFCQRLQKVRQKKSSLRAQQEEVRTLTRDEILKLLKTEKEVKKAEPEKTVNPEPILKPAHTLETREKPKAPDREELLKRHRIILERALGEKLPDLPSFEGYDLAFCKALLRKGYEYEEVGKAFVELLKRHVFYQSMREEERKTYLMWLADKVRKIQEEFKQEKDLKQESKPYRRRR